MNLTPTPSSKNHERNQQEILEVINNLTELIYFLYALHASHLQKVIYEKKGKKIEDLGKFRILFFHIQTLTSLLQNVKHYHKISGFFCQIVGDTIAYIPYPASYILKEDVITHRTITQKDLSEILMLFSATGASIMPYLLVTGQLKLAAVLIIHNKTAFRLAQVLKSRNAHLSGNPNQSPLPHDKEE